MLAEKFKLVKTKYHRIKEFLEAWFSYFPILWKCYDFDSSSILIVQQHQTKRVCNYIKKYGIHINKHRDIRHMKLVIKLIDVYLKDDALKCTYKKDILNTIDEYMRTDNKWQCTKHVNTRNWKRFIYTDPTIDGSHDVREIMKAELYQRKVWHLIQLINEYFQEQWWD